jgi:hypothetical protein
VNGRLVEATPINQPVADVVFRLEEALEKAKSGEMRTVCIVGSVVGTDGFTAYATNDIVTSIGLLALLQHQLMMIEAKQSGRLP